MFTRPRLDGLQDALGDDLVRFIPELLVAAGVVALLLARLVRLLDRSHLGGLAVAVLAVALFAAVAGFPEATGSARQGAYFAGMLVADPFAGYVRIVVLAAATLTVLLTRVTGLPDAEDSADFYALVLGGALGMMLMAASNHLLMAFIAVEMASLPSYALAGFLKGRRTGGEAALKYVVFGAGASGVMLYGISLTAGTFGTGYLPDVAAGAGARLAGEGGFDPVLLAGVALTLVGLGFKLAAVPFHFWCPDVFAGAAAEVAGFLSVASKAAAVALTARLVYSFHASCPDPWLVPRTLGVGLGVVGAMTVTFGNLAAFAQTDLKRLLAYSTIAHAGYMLLGLAALTAGAASAVLYYLVAYLLMNLGAFAVVAVVRNATGSEDVAAVRGLAWRSPVAAVAMAVFLFSLLGFPPLAGFAGKFQVFAAVYDAARSAPGWLGTAFGVFLAVGAVNTAVSAVYYLKVVRAMVLDDAPESPPVATGWPASLLLVALAAGVIALGVVWNPLTTAADGAATAIARPATPGVPTR
ncbi:NADH-quinone oxidoreductase subunit N [Urbifossiella limnaea]|uniref:NADH-quinone oxidoreductase subunit N n=1 Tax=Urbifossiella limnaea TaxID=2528023 RepID=A0A517XVW4_9BACT|nr:NADH-quinone oxidoreductase subunit N [Urbifossiella limnaea]QDU21650.1 NADH-quinone oxidoreductase subunit N [Urbifossiella limnaea]